MKSRPSRTMRARACLCLAVLGVVALAGINAVSPAMHALSNRRALRLSQVQALGMSEQEALAKPVVVAIKTHHFFGSYARTVPDCTWNGKKIGCMFVDRVHQSDSSADALWFHVPSHCGGTVHRDAPHQLAVAMSMEASTYYTCLDDMNFMDQFEIEMTYRRCSHVQSGYFVDSGVLMSGSFFRAPVPFSEMHSAIVYVNSNCGALNGRNDIVRQLMELNRIPVDSWGQCLRNKVAPQGRFDKVEIFRPYKFCIAMENSNSLDYVTEKIWHALDAGCLPIYLGAPNIEDYVPSPESVIDYRKFNSPALLMDYLVKLSNNEALYQQHHAWRTAPVDQLSPGFRKMVLSHVGAQHSQCALCAVIMDHRVNKTPLKHTHCLRNSTWMAVKNKGQGSTWAAASDALLKQPWPLPARTVLPSR